MLWSDYSAELKEKGTVTISVRARPGASKTRVKDILSDGSVKIDIAAVPEDNNANKELLRFIAKAFSVEQSDVSLISGLKSKRKLVRITLPST
jgi:uncharacterized protein (TIGR00251 family)